MFFLGERKTPFSLGVPKTKKMGQKKESSKEIVEVSRAEGYYCIEYNMFPDDPEPTKVDLVMFGLAAKVYMANESKVNYTYLD